MLTEKMLKYFLTTAYEDVGAEQYQFLVNNYFTKPKDDWYEEKEINGRKEKVWDKTKVARFWILIREYAMKFGIENKNFDFWKFIFPDFEEPDDIRIKDGKLRYTENFWHKGQPKEFSENVGFSSTKFLGEADFSETLFKKKVGFGAVFFEKANFKEAIFSKDAIFVYSEFLGKSVFIEAKFSGEANFEDVKFLSDTYICDVIFSGEAHFNNAVFSSVTTFTSTFFLGKTSFIETTFSDSSNFWSIKFSGDNSVLFQDLKGNENDVLKLEFSTINFTDKIIFRGVNLKNAIFGQSDITEVKFKNCIWNENSGRIILNYEKGFGFEDDSNYKELEDVYRQLKVNFDSSKLGVIRKGLCERNGNA